MILTSKQVHPAIQAWDDNGHMISNDVAQTVASWYHSPGPGDEQMARLSHGLPFDAAALLAEIDQVPFTETPAELFALRAWVVTKLDA